MHSVPPTIPGPMPRAALRLRQNPILLGMVVHVCCVVVTSIFMPIAMGSNIWPIAAVFWMVLSIPVAAVSGALMGAALRRSTSAIQLKALIATGVSLAVIVGAIMSRT